MIPRIYAYVAGLVILAGLLFAGGWSAYSHGEAAQAARDKVKIDKANTDRDTATEQAQKAAAALQQVNETARNEATRAAQQQARAAAGALVLQQQADLAKKDAAAWAAKYRAALATPACRNAQEELCPALSDY